MDATCPGVKAGGGVVRRGHPPGGRTKKEPPRGEAEAALVETQGIRRWIQSGSWPAENARKATMPARTMFRMVSAMGLRWVLDYSKSWPHWPVFSLSEALIQELAVSNWK